MIRNINVDDTTEALPFAKHVLQDSAFTHLGLFEGIGGFSLAAEWMGWKTLAWCEWNEFGQKVLRHHFPNAEGFGDITKTDFIKYANRIDILTGGFPCQPYSVAGKRKGKEDERHLWPEMLRAIREIEPTYVVGEYVSGIVNWDGGLVFNEVQADLEHQGYEVQPFILPACAKDAPHRRDRVWFIAYSDSRRNKRLQYELGKPKEIRQGGGRIMRRIATKMLPTPCASDNRDRGGPKDKAIQRRLEIGKSIELSMMVDGPLNPLFVEQMMGFPSNWTALPFQDGQKKV